MDTNDPEEIGNLVAHLDGARGIFSGTLIDYRMPCTVTEDATCQIVSNLSVWNEFLCWIHLELRELPKTGRQIGLVHVPERCFRNIPEYHLHRAAAVLYWLFKTHRCVASVHIPSMYTSTEECDKCPRPVFWKVLYGNCSIKSLTVASSSRVDIAIFYNVLLSLKCLEEFESCDISNDSLYSTAITTLIRTTTTLTVLNLSKVLFLRSSQALIFFTALKANTSLRALSLGSGAIKGDPTSFVQFLASNATLQHLVLYGSSCFHDGTLKCIFEGMLKNGAVWSLELDNFILDSESVELGARMLRENKVLRCFRFSTRVSAHEHLMTDLSRQGILGNIGTWHEAVSQNNTLQNMRLCFGIWTAEHWGSFFRILPQHRSLKMVTIDVQEMEYAHMAGVVRELELSGSEEKVCFKAPCRIDTLAISDCKRCSELKAYVPINDEPNCLTVFQQLPALSYLNALSLWMQSWDSAICSLLAQYIATTSVLRKLHIQLNFESYPRESVEWFAALSQSLRLNRSITELGIGACDSPSEVVAVVARAVRLSATIRKICLLHCSAPALLTFIRRLSAGIVKNRTLCSTASDYEWICNVNKWFVVLDTARRNSGFVARAAQFLNHARCDRHCAAGLDRVSRHPALVAELAEVLSIGKVEAADMVQRRFRNIEGLHEFMRLAGVVKGRVTCLPRGDGRTQLDDLNDDCWAHVRRYLELDDVACSSESP